MSQAIEVRLGEYREVNLYDVNHVDCGRGDYVIMEAERGSEFGRVVSRVNAPGAVPVETKGRGKVLRKATEGDLRQIANNRTKVQDAMNICARKITDRKLQMHVLRAEYTFDSSKIIFFFTSDGRVDFRHLVKDLAKVFRVRIELRQIGVRDKAKILNGYGLCGRELCCASYMKGFHSLSIRMAKEQGLPLNPTRISGVCGRIKCCMAYEFAVYRELARSLPRVGDKITTGEGRGKVIDVHVLKRIVTVDMGEGQIVRTVYPRDISGAGRPTRLPAADRPATAAEADENLSPGLEESDDVQEGDIESLPDD